MTDMDKAKQIAAELLELCKNPEICARIADMFWDANYTENCVSEAEDVAMEAGYDSPVEIQPGLRLPNFLVTMIKCNEDDHAFVYGEPT